MKYTLCLILAAATVQVFGAAPDSLSGKVYREYRLMSGVTNATESTLVLKVDGTYVTLKQAHGTVEMNSREGVLPEAHWGAIRNPSADGRFEYRKTAENEGVLTLIPEGGAGRIEDTLYFSSAYEGSTSRNGLNGLGGQAFHLTDLPTGNSTSVCNLSVRGNVVAGRPLILGFVIPGNLEREILIRVVGPTLATFGVTGAWSTPTLQLYKGATPVFGPTFKFPAWSDVPPAAMFPGTVMSPEQGLRKIFSFVGAVPFPSGSKDIAIVVRLSPGAYTAIAAAQTGDAGGEALIEYYPLP